VRLRFRIQTAASPGNAPGGGELVDRVVDVEPAADEVRIGRRSGVEIQLPFSTVSSIHARVFRHGDGWALVDMGSSNGTFVGTTRLASGQPRVLRLGDVFRLADVTISFEGEAGASSAPDDKRSKTESTATLARRLVNDLFQAVAGAETARVVVDKGPSAGQSLSLALPDRSYKVGRSPECDLVLSDDDVSREHVAFERRWQGVFVRDLGSKNGVEIDGQKIRGEQRVHDGEVVSIGGSQLRIDDPEERYLRQMEADAREAPRKATAPAAPAAAAPVAPAEVVPPKAPAPAAEPGPVVKAPVVAPAKPAPAAQPAAVAKPVAKPAAPAAIGDKGGGDSAAAAKRKPSVEVAPVKGQTGGKDSGQGGKASKDVEPAGRKGGAAEYNDIPASSRVLPFFVTLLSLSVLGGVAYLIWVMFWGMGSGGAP
jgi:pSer/pThr/pTyr-binding forkhead associated (FHA) protein